MYQMEEIEKNLREEPFKLLLSKIVNEHPGVTEKHGNLYKQLDLFKDRIKFSEDLANTKNSDTSE